MHTPTIDHQEHPEPGDCNCHPSRLCPNCLARLQRVRHDLELKDWRERWGNVPRRTPRQTPHLRLVPGGR